MRFTYPHMYPHLKANVNNSVRSAPSSSSLVISSHSRCGGHWRTFAFEEMVIRAITTMSK